MLSRTVACLKNEYFRAPKRLEDLSDPLGMLGMVHWSECEG